MRSVKMQSMGVYKFNYVVCSNTKKAIKACTFTTHKTGAKPTGRVSVAEWY
jgi:hypothetical protein